MKRSVLDKWAAEYLGETGDSVHDAVAAEFYTTSPGAAFVVLAKAIDEGHKVELTAEDGRIDVECDEGEAKGSADNMAQVIVEACYRCHNGMQEKVEDDGDDA